MERAHGELIHILHQDDFVEDDYYAHIELLAAEHPNAGLYATRCFYVDADLTIVGVSNCVQEMETPRLGPEPFFYETPIQCSAVTVRRSAYRDLGNFRLDMGYVTDCEMWARISDAHGAVVCPGVKASFRMGHGSETSRMLRSAEAIEDISRLNRLLERRYPSFDPDRGRARASDTAWHSFRTFRKCGDHTASVANYKAWASITSLRRRLGYHARHRLALVKAGLWQTQKN